MAILNSNANRDENSGIRRKPRVNYPNGMAVINITNE